MQNEATTNGSDKPPKTKSEKASAKSDALLTGPDPSGPIELRMVRTADLVLNQDKGDRAWVLGTYIANGGTIDGVVNRLVLYPNGVVVATVRKQRRHGEEAVTSDKHIVMRGNFEGEVLTETERQRLLQKGLIT